MNRLNILSLFAIAALGLALLPTGAVAQQKTLKEQLVGTWMIVSVETTNADGSKSLPFTATPKGITIFDAAGHYVVFNISPNLPKVASNNRLSGTADDYVPSSHSGVRSTAELRSILPSPGTSPAKRSTT